MSETKKCPDGSEPFEFNGGPSCCPKGSTYSATKGSGCCYNPETKKCTPVPTPPVCPYAKEYSIKNKEVKMTEKKSEECKVGEKSKTYGSTTYCCPETENFFNGEVVWCCPATTQTDAPSFKPNNVCKKPKKLGDANG